MTKLRGKTTGTYEGWVTRPIPTGRETPENCQRMERCPRFDICSAPKCPIDALYERRVFLEDEEVCKLNKPHRIRLFGDLETHGLFPAELRGVLQTYGSWDAYMLAKRGKAQRKLENDASLNLAQEGVL